MSKSSNTPPLSRTARKPITLPQGVQVELVDRDICLSGPKGKLKLNVPESISVDLPTDSGAALLLRPSDGHPINNALMGTYRQLINNNVIGVSQGYTKALLLQGVGYRAQVQNNILTLSLGYSHPIEYELHASIQASVEGNTKIVLSGCDKQKIGQVAAEIRSFRPPEPYKGKGVRYEHEVIKLKPGKQSTKK